MWDNFATPWAQATMMVAGLLALLILWLGLRLDRWWCARWEGRAAAMGLPRRTGRHHVNRYTRPTIRMDNEIRKALLGEGGPS